jgi:uncharacterized SAM-binding protein YcdF (DUF218 family)
MRGFFGFLFKLSMALVFLFICSAAAMVFDGLNDEVNKADVALVIESSASGKGGANPVLDRVVQMQRTGEISSVLVIGSTWPGDNREDATAMVTYLETHGVPSGDIIQSDHGGTMQETARLAAGFVKLHRFTTVMIVAEYYDITRLKLALEHEGIKGVQKVHVGSVHKEDAVEIVRSLVALYDYVGRVYLLPEALQMKKEAQVGMDKASVEAQKAKDKVNNSLDNMAK